MMQQKSSNPLIYRGFSSEEQWRWHRPGTDGAASQIRTTRITNAVLYRLSYCGFP